MAANNEDPELIDLIMQSFQANGILAKLKAQLKASVYLTLEEENGANQLPLANEKMQTWWKRSDTKVILFIIKDFLQYFQLDYTLNVLESEAKMTEMDFTDVMSSVDEMRTTHDTPIIYNVLKNAQTNAPSTSDESTRHKPSDTRNDTTYDSDKLDADHAFIRPITEICVESNRAIDSMSIKDVDQLLSARSTQSNTDTLNDTSSIVEEIAQVESDQNDLFHRLFVASKDNHVDANEIISHTPCATNGDKSANCCANASQTTRSNQAHTSIENGAPQQTNRDLLERSEKCNGLNGQRGESERVTTNGECGEATTDDCNKSVCLIDFDTSIKLPKLASLRDLPPLPNVSKAIIDSVNSTDESTQSSECARYKPSHKRDQTPKCEASKVEVSNEEDGPPTHQSI